MINFTVLKSAADAKRYYSPTGHDYWIEDKAQHAFFGGKLTQRFGLNEFNVDAFHDLCDGVIPGSRTDKNKEGDRLTPGRRDDSRAGWDITVDGPKDLGVLLAIGGDDRIVNALERAGRDVMAVIERDAKARVRVRGQDTDRDTGEIIYTGVLHTTARPVGDKIDVQPHFHFVVANVTYDPVEHKLKALQLQPFAANGAKEARPYYTAYFNNQLANYIQDLGYSIERTKDSFKVVGVPDRVRAEFSQRTNKIEEVAAILEKQKQEFMGNPYAKLSAASKAKLGAHTRERKQPGKTWDSLMAHWKSRVSEDEEKTVLNAVIASHREPEQPKHDMEREALEWSLEHVLERKAVASQRQVITEALKQGIGRVKVDSLYSELGKLKGVIRRNVDGVEMVSTKGVLDEEKQLVQFAVKGRGRFKPLSALAAGRTTRCIPNLATLSPSQQAAIQHVWTSPDRLILIRGAAGTGKTTLTKAALEGINKPWVILAPSSEASRGVLRRDGFENADTLAKFLTDEDMQASVNGGVIWLDEASLAGSHDIAKLVKLAERLNARVVLSGDRRQHKSVSRGDILTLLEDRAGLPAAEVSEIRRQSGEYKAAVAALSKGHTGAGFDKLDTLGWIKEGGLVDDYMEAVNAGKSVLVVSPTHAEGDKVTAAIRERMKHDGKLGEAHLVKQLKPLNLTKAELKEVKKHPEPGVLTTKFAAFTESALELAKGDVVRITSNGKDATGKHRLNNGAMYTINGFDKHGNIRLSNGWTLDRDFGHLAHGYVVTSHASQGKTVDVALLAMGSESLPAMSAAQFYVSASRAKQKTMIYVDDKEEVREAIRREDVRLLASDLVRKPRVSLKQRLKRHIDFIRSSMSFSQPTNKQPEVSYER